MQAGDLRERATLQRLADADDGRGGQADAWDHVTDLWASILPTNGRESLEAGALTGVQGWRVTLRYRADLDSEAGVRHRLAWNGRLLNIRSIADPDGRRQKLVAFCESGVAQ
jgi:SPP1 family predicted phage head-tail adaptor